MLSDLFIRAIRLKALPPEEQTGEVVDAQLDIVVGYLDTESRKIIPLVPQEEEPADEAGEDDAQPETEPLDEEFAADVPGEQA